jgi:diguanylate cyclase (GGDEF)-like protein
MNLSFGPVLVVVVATTASALILIGSPGWLRARRARHLALVDFLLASSYIGTSGAGTPPPTPAGSTGMHPSAGGSGTPEDEADPAASQPDVPHAATHRTLLDGAAFEKIVDHEDAREERYRRPTTIVVLELDGLDRLVDRLGPAAAERIEPEVADTIAKLARKADYVARFAPGRFAVLMPETDEIVAINFVERIRHACEEWLASGAIAMRLAIGWASTSGDASVSTAAQVAVDRLHLERRRNARLATEGAAGEPPTA